jgi:hypothetical protein
MRAHCGAPPLSRELPDERDVVRGQDARAGKVPSQQCGATVTSGHQGLSCMRRGRDHRGSRHGTHNVHAALPALLVSAGVAHWNAAQRMCCKPATAVYCTLQGAASWQVAASCQFSQGPVRGACCWRAQATPPGAALVVPKSPVLDDGPKMTELKAMSMRCRAPRMRRAAEREGGVPPGG